MPRYIDADALLNELKEELEFDSPMYNEVENKWLNKGLRIAIKDVKRFPTANVAPIADTVKKMQERLKVEFGNSRYQAYRGNSIHNIIDQIAKEILEGGDTE